MAKAKDTPATEPVPTSAPEASVSAADSLAAIKRQGLSAGNFSELKAAFVDLVELIELMTVGGGD